MSIPTMPATKRTQFLMEPDEFRRLKAEARRRKKSVGELIRAAVREAYLRDSARESAERRAAVDDLLAIRLPFTFDWKEVKEEIESRFDEQPE